MSDNGTRFIQEWKPILDPYAKKLNIPVEFMLAQLGQESGWGLHTPAGSNNYGGVIETRRGVKGVEALDAGRRRRFRQFADKNDFANFWTGMLARRFKGVVGAKTIEDYTNALQGGKYKYAESKDYANTLSSVLNNSVLPRLKAGTTMQPQATNTGVVSTAVSQQPVQAKNALLGLASTAVNDWGLEPSFGKEPSQKEVDPYAELFTGKHVHKLPERSATGVGLTNVQRDYGKVNTKWLE